MTKAREHAPRTFIWIAHTNLEQITTGLDKLERRNPQDAKLIKGMRESLAELHKHVHQSNHIIDALERTKLSLMNTNNRHARERQRLVAVTNTATGLCEQCRGTMPVFDGPGRRRRTCSDACRQAAYRARVAKADRPVGDDRR